MKKLAITLRYLQFYSHMSHNLVSGSSFFSDHEFLGDLYAAYEAAYDSVVERMIGLKQSVDIIKLTDAAEEMLEKVPYTDIRGAFTQILQGEQMLCSIVEEEIKNNNPSEGTKQLIGEICNQSEMRQYKLQQRLK